MDWRRGKFGGILLLGSGRRGTYSTPQRKSSCFRSRLRLGLRPLFSARDSSFLSRGLCLCYSLAPFAVGVDLSVGLLRSWSCCGVVSGLHLMGQFGLFAGSCCFSLGSRFLWWWRRYWQLEEAVEERLAAYRLVAA